MILQRLYERYRHRRFKCGEDDDGYPIKVKLKYFLRYVACQRDDSPLYIFDSGFEGDGKARSLMDDFTIPQYFRDDLFRLVGELRRPPYRWFLVGPKRSGTCVHIDPLGPSAWNALVSGRKRWVLFPPGTPKSLVKAKEFQKKDEDDEAIVRAFLLFLLLVSTPVRTSLVAWKPEVQLYIMILLGWQDYFNQMLPRMRATSGGDEVLGTIEFVQRPGETVFIPGGWWHAVMNLDDTIAVTHNFASPVNFPFVRRPLLLYRRLPLFVLTGFVCIFFSPRSLRYRLPRARAGRCGVQPGLVAGEWPGSGWESWTRRTRTWDASPGSWMRRTGMISP